METREDYIIYFRDMWKYIEAAQEIYSGRGMLLLDIIASNEKYNKIVADFNAKNESEWTVFDIFDKADLSDVSIVFEKLREAVIDQIEEYRNEKFEAADDEAAQKLSGIREEAVDSLYSI